MNDHSYHATNKITPEQQEGYDKAAQGQESAIFDYAMKHPWSLFHADTEDIKALFPAITPITSIRRAISNLKRDGKLVKMYQVEGAYGRPVDLHRVNVELLGRKTS